MGACLFVTIEISTEIRSLVPFPPQFSSAGLCLRACMEFQPFPGRTSDARLHGHAHAFRACTRACGAAAAHASFAGACTVRRRTPTSTTRGACRSTHAAYRHARDPCQGASRRAAYAHVELRTYRARSTD